MGLFATVLQDFSEDELFVDEFLRASEAIMAVAEMERGEISRNWALFL